MSAAKHKVRWTTKRKDASVKKCVQILDLELYTTCKACDRETNCLRFGGNFFCMFCLSERIEDICRLYNIVNDSRIMNRLRTNKRVFNLRISK